MDAAVSRPVKFVTFVTLRRHEMELRSNLKRVRCADLNTWGQNVRVQLKVLHDWQSRIELSGALKA